MIADGRAIADSIYAELAGVREKLKSDIKLGIIVGERNPVIESFVKIKTRAAERMHVTMVREDLPDGASTEEAVLAVQKMAQRVDALIVQLPLPKTIDTNIVLSAIPAQLDVDAINPTIPDDERPVFAPVALAAVEVLNRFGVEIRGRRAVVVGAGRLVGAPSAVLLKRLGANVGMFTLEKGSIEDLKTADIVVLGTGNPGFIKPDHLREGVALIDAGASESEGKIRGDADPGCAEKASVFTPVPGGIGPMAVAMIFRNLFDLLGAKKNG